MKLTEDDIVMLGGPKACKRLQQKGLLTNDNKLTSQGKRAIDGIKVSLTKGVQGVPADMIKKTWLHDGVGNLVKTVSPWKTVRCFNTTWLATNSCALYGKKLPGVVAEECQKVPEVTAKALRFLLSKTERTKSRSTEVALFPHTFQLQEAKVNASAVLWLADHGQNDFVPINAAYFELATRLFPTVSFYAKRGPEKMILLGYVVHRGLGGIVAVVAPLTASTEDLQMLIPKKRPDWKGGIISAKTS